MRVPLTGVIVKTSAICLNTSESAASKLVISEEVVNSKRSSGATLFPFGR